MEVTYAIKGFSAMAIPLESVRTAVHQNIVDAHTAGVELLPGMSNDIDQTTTEGSGKKRGPGGSEEFILSFSGLQM